MKIENRFPEIKLSFKQFELRLASRFDRHGSTPLTMTETLKTFSRSQKLRKGFDLLVSKRD
jgi:hypothetical protein